MINDNYFFEANFPNWYSDFRERTRRRMFCTDNPHDHLKRGIVSPIVLLVVLALFACWMLSPNQASNPLSLGRFVVDTHAVSFRGEVTNCSEIDPADFLENDGLRWFLVAIDGPNI